MVMLVIVVAIVVMVATKVVDNVGGTCGGSFGKNGTVEDDGEQKNDAGSGWPCGFGVCCGFCARAVLRV